LDVEGELSFGFRQAFKAASCADLSRSVAYEPSVWDLLAIPSVDPSAPEIEPWPFGLTGHWKSAFTLLGVT
jgi:hypothetical protein